MTVRYLTLAEVRDAIAQQNTRHVVVARIHGAGAPSPESERAIDDIARAAFARMAQEGGR